MATLALTDADEGDVGAAFYELETFVRDLGRRAHRPPGALIPEGGQAEIFVPVRGPVAPTGRIGFRRLPSSRAATVIVRGPYDLVADGRRALERWVDAAGLQPAGALRIIYLQFGAEPELRLPRSYLVERDADLVTELQLPVA